MKTILKMKFDNKFSEATHFRKYEMWLKVK